MNQEEFVKQGRGRWVAFEELLGLVERRGRARLDELPHLYRVVCRDLAIARQRQFDAHVVDHLNSLVLNAHQQLYKPSRGSYRRFIDFLARDFPRVVRAEARLVGLATFLFYGSALAIYLLILWRPELIYSLMDPSDVRNVERMYNPAGEHFLRERTADSDTAMFGFYIRNNISIAFRTFASGLFFGVGSLFLLIFNGLLIGAVAAHLGNVGFVHNLAVFVIGHGSLELTAITFSAAAGLRLGWSLVAPGPWSRAEAIRRAALRAIPIVYGATAMLLGAAAVEAYWSSSVSLPPAVKFTVGGLGWVALVLYFLFAGRRGD